MSFSGRVNRESHLGGLLVDFEGRPPRLGTRIRVSGGKILGRVDTVIGPVGSALIHVHPLYNGIDARASVGSPVEIAPRERPRQDRSRGRHSGGNFRERGGPRRVSSGSRGDRSFRGNKGGGSRGRGPGGQGGRSSRDNKGGGSRGRGPGGQGGRSFRDNKGGGSRGRGSGNSGRKTGNSGRRRDSGKSGGGNRRR